MIQKRYKPALLSLTFPLSLKFSMSLMFPLSMESAIIQQVHRDPFKRITCSCDEHTNNPGDYAVGSLTGWL